MIRDIAIDKTDMAHIQTAIEHLRERFDTVQIFCTRHDPITGVTCREHMGAGDWFARFGVVQMWIENEKFIDTRERYDAIHPPRQEDD